VGMNLESKFSSFKLCDMVQRGGHKKRASPVETSKVILGRLVAVFCIAAILDVMVSMSRANSEYAVRTL
jgi:hypothetical protein